MGGNRKRGDRIKRKLSAKEVIKFTTLTVSSWL